MMSFKEIYKIPYPRAYWKVCPETLQLFAIIAAQNQVNKTQSTLFPSKMKNQNRIYQALGIWNDT